MRIRNYRQGDIPTLAHIQQMAATADGTEPISLTDFDTWLAQPELDPQYNVFVITDDDESNEWGQAGTLEGIEGEAIGYTILQLRESQHAYHFLCEGAVHPQHRRRGAGTALLICALNRAHIWAMELEMGEREHLVYFEVLLPLKDQTSENLAQRCELQPTDERVLIGMRLYRRVL
jgi:GNAT superfamily N-acetyltransferase